MKYKQDIGCESDIKEYKQFCLSINYLISNFSRSIVLKFGFLQFGQVQFHENCSPLVFILNCNARKNLSCKYKSSKFIFVIIYYN